uniref:EGF-like domain-containing protein n=1 Tax=Mesocestoides corti TaxID=53468 RepID=A0A5K3F7E6_MESCO
MDWQSLFVLLSVCTVPSRVSAKYEDVDGILYHLEHLDFQFGYPADVFGYIFPTFAVTSEVAEGKYEHRCTLHPDHMTYSSPRCRNAIVALHGIMGAKFYKAQIENTSQWPYNPFPVRSVDANTPRWTKSLYDQKHVHLPVYHQDDLVKGRSHNEASGLLTTKRMTQMIAIFDACAKALAGWSNDGSMRELACGYAEFLKVMHDTNAGTPQAGVWVLPQTDSRTMSGLFWLLFCKHAWHRAIEVYGMNRSHSDHPSCPNTCARYEGNPCVGKANVVQVSHVAIDPERRTLKGDRIFGMQICKPMGAGVMDYEYMCVCRKGYVWSRETRSCVFQDGCSRDPVTGSTPCSPKGTRLCISSVVNLPNAAEAGGGGAMRLPYVCSCYSGYMGPRCEQKRNACIELPGNQACRVHLGNNCKPLVGTNVYTCHCNGMYERDKAVAFPNCYRRKSICSRMGWRGRHCEIPDIRQWLPWESWSRCSATMCTGLGWRRRIRKCRVNVTLLEDKGMCSGDDVQRQLCKVMCPDSMSSYVLLTKMILLFSAGCVILVAAVGIVFLRVKIEVA